MVGGQLTRESQWILPAGRAIDHRAAVVQDYPDADRFSDDHGGCAGRAASVFGRTEPPEGSQSDLAGTLDRPLGGRDVGDRYGGNERQKLAEHLPTHRAIAPDRALPPERFRAPAGGYHH